MREAMSSRLETKLFLHRHSRSLNSVDMIRSCINRLVTSMWYVGRQNIGERGPGDVKGNSKAESRVEVKDRHHYWRYRRARKPDKKKG